MVRLSLALAQIITVLSCPPKGESTLPYELQDSVQHVTGPIAITSYDPCRSPFLELSSPFTVRQALAAFKVKDASNIQASCADQLPS